MNEDSGMVLYRCPWCPVQVPVPPWKLDTSDLDPGQDSWTIRITRAAWELTMLDHWRVAHPERYTDYADPLVAEMGADIQVAADSMRQQARSMERVSNGGLWSNPGRDILTDVISWEAKRYRPGAVDPTFADFMHGWSGL